MTYTISPNSMTKPQREYIAAMQKRLHLPDALLDNHCVENFGADLAHLDIREASQLIDQMKGWEQLPADLMRAKGQRDLPGFESS